MWPQWMPTCGIACARGCPTAACKNFLNCGKGPSTRDGDSTPRQFHMDKEDEMRRRCSFLYSTSAYSESTPRLRVAASVSNTGDEYDEDIGASSVDATAVSHREALMGGGAKNAHSAVLRGRTFGKSTFDDEEVLFEARPASVDVFCRGKGKLLEPHADVSWPDWDSPKDCASSRKRSPVRHCRVSTASTSAGTSCYSPRRSSMASRSSWASMPAAEPPAPVEGKAMLATFPLPVGIRAWDWPLSRHEKKSLVLMFDRQELMVQRDDLADQLSKLQSEKL